MKESEIKIRESIADCLTHDDYVPMFVQGDIGEYDSEQIIDVIENVQSEIRGGKEEVIKNFWLDNFISKNLCSLCGNRGIIDTRGRAISAAGVDSGKENFCICPNGRVLTSG